MEETSNESIIEPTSVLSTETENPQNPFAESSNSFATGDSSNGDSNPFAGNDTGSFGGGFFGDPLAPDEGYEYDLGEDSGLPVRNPFDGLLEFEEFDNLGDIFGDLDPSDNPFANSSASSEDVLPSTNGGNIIGGFPTASGNDLENETTDGVEEMPFSGDGSMMNADFSGIDNGADNTDNGNGNNFYGDNNLADGNGNWSFGDSNQINGNGNWNLNEEGTNPFDNLFEGENNFLTGGNPLGVGEEGGMTADALGGNNPFFAGSSSTTPTTVGEGEIPDTAENPTGNQNTVNGNGNWNFGSNNNTSGNGNWNFGDNNLVTNGNGNWNLGDDNEVSGNGNRPSGNDNSISGNSNAITGDGNSINGNRFSLDESDLNISGNGDRYLQTDADGDVSLVSDESKSDPNYDFEGVVKFAEDSEVDQLLNGGELFGDDNLAGQDILDGVYASLNTFEGFNNTGTGSLPSNDDPVDGASGIFPVGEVPADISPDVLPFS